MSAQPLHSLPETSAGDAGRARGAFSLIEGDALSTLFARLGLGSHRPFVLLRRSLALVLLTWVPVALLAARQGMCTLEVTPTNFCADFAAYAQFLLALPLFVIAEAIIDPSTREAARQFVSCGVVRPADGAILDRVHATLER